VRILANKRCRRYDESQGKPHGRSSHLAQDLELAKYVNDRGAAKLKFLKDQELPDPAGVQNRF
jgi:hypothetical protein